MADTALPQDDEAVRAHGSCYVWAEASVRAAVKDAIDVVFAECDR